MNKNESPAPNTVLVRGSKRFTMFMPTECGFVHLFLVVVIVIIGVGGLLYYSWQKGLIKTTPQSELSPIPTAALDETVNWKTYTNNTLGFQIKYPPSWSDPQEYLQSTGTTVEFDKTLTFWVGVYYNQDLGRTITFEEYIEQNTPEGEIAQEYTLGGKMGKIIKYKTGEGLTGNLIAVPGEEGQNGIFAVEYNIYPGEVESFELIQKVLSSLKFQTTISDWKTYTNTEFGYSVKIPKDTELNDYSNDVYLSLISFGNSQNKDGLRFSVSVSESTLEEEAEFAKWESSHSLVTLVKEEDTIIKAILPKNSSTLHRNLRNRDQLLL